MSTASLLVLSASAASRAWEKNIAPFAWKAKMAGLYDILSVQWNPCSSHVRLQEGFATWQKMNYAKSDFLLLAYR